jgi:hypothetical protein
LAHAGLAVLNSLTFDWMARRIISGLHLNKFYLAGLVWPRLDSSAVTRLSNLTALMLKQSPRIPPGMSKLAVGEVGEVDANVEYFAKIEAEVERTIARAFKLEPSMLRRIFSTVTLIVVAFGGISRRIPTCLVLLRTLLMIPAHPCPLVPSRSLWHMWRRLSTELSCSSISGPWNWRDPCPTTSPLGLLATR